MDLHDHAILGRHLRHLGQHVTVVEGRLGRVEEAFEGLAVQGFDLGSGQARGHEARYVVILRRRATSVSHSAI